ncbi:MAG: methanogenesis marker protein Mmp4/MtxX [Methanosarcinales archaeon]|jgi:putative methanogen marker protein 4|nr:methanogenesis marker protein Mmp4/MtxX [Methanosarcinales archaeon]
MNLDDRHKLLDLIEKYALKKRSKVAIGIREPTSKMLRSIESAHNENYAEVVLVGNRKDIEKKGTTLEIINSNVPEKTIIELLKTDTIDAVVRGTAYSSDTISNLKKSCGLEKIYRISLLLTHDGTPFFLAPVGIDEGGCIEDKIELINRGVTYMRKLDIEPVVGILSGGRFSDIGRDARVDCTMRDAEIVAERIKKQGISVTHYSILIEDAIKNANFIIAPDGISGNLIFRTLVFLGGGDGVGAPILMDKYIFIDTSRVGGHWKKAIMLASALVNIK